MSPRDSNEHDDALNRWIRRHPGVAIFIFLAFIAMGLTFRYLKSTS